MRSKRLFQTLTRPVLFAAAYYCAARLGLMLIVHPESVSVFWPAAGLLLGILIVSRKRDWRWILPLAVISHFIAEMSIVVNPWLAAGFSLVEPLGAALAVLLLQRIAGEGMTLDRVGNVLVLLLIPLLVTNPLSATLGSLIRMAGRGQPRLWDVWLVWWTSISLGVTVVTPVVMTWPDFILGIRTAKRSRIVEGVLLAMTFVVACTAIFAMPAYRGLVILPLLCLPFPIFMWAAARFGPTGVAMSSLLVSIFGLWQTTRKQGAIAAIAAKVEQDVLMLQIYLAVIICFSLLLSAAIGQQRRTLRALRESEARYRSLVEYLPDGITVSLDDRLVYANAAAAEIVGAKNVGTLVGRSIWEFIHEDFIEVVKLRRAQMLSSQASASKMEGKLRRLDGTVIDIEGHGVAIDFDGKRAIQNCIRDVTDRKVAEEQLKNTSGQLRALMARLQTAREEEGIRISREIHDELGSAFTSLRWDLEEADRMISEAANSPRCSEIRQRIKKMFDLIDGTINVVRRISSELRPSILDDLGLAEAVEWQLEQFQARTGIICRLESHSAESPNFDQNQATAVFRIFQEALTNVLRHAEATAVNVTMDEDETGFELRIKDNGKGFVSDHKAGADSLGFLGMRERAQLIGGTVEIAGLLGEGTTVILRIPATGNQSA